VEAQIEHVFVIVNIPRWWTHRLRRNRLCVTSVEYSIAVIVIGIALP